MVSTYEYCALADVEAFTGIDYSTLHATKFTAALIDAKITIAERMINAYLGVTVAQTKTDGIISAAIIISAKILHGAVLELGVHGELEHAAELIDMSVPAILRMFLTTDIGVDAIPMSAGDLS